MDVPFGRLGRVVAVLGLVGVMPLGGAFAQDSGNRVAVTSDWSVFTDENPKQCWGVAIPKETVNTKDGQQVQVRRGDILLFVTFNPGKPAEISFSGGYPFAEKSTVDVAVGDKAFKFVTDGEWAWSAAGEEGAILDAMKNGAQAVVTAKSGKGTQTKDTFSLRGFTAAVTEAETRCK